MPALTHDKAQMMLSPREQERYSRHLAIEGFEEAHQLKLQQATVLVVGAGGLGCPVLQYLAAAGVGKIGIADADTVSESNLQRQILFGEAEIGQPKAEIAARKIQNINSLCEVKVYTDFITSSNAEEITKGYDVIVGATDNFNSRYLLDQLTEKNGQCYVHGSIREYSGQVCSFTPESKARYHQLFPGAQDDDEHAIGVMGALPGIIGSIMAMEVIKQVCELDGRLINKLLLYDALACTQNIIDTSAF